MVHNIGMEKRFDNIFISKRDNFLMAITGLSAIFLLALVLQTTIIIEPVRVFISILLILITFLFNLLLGTQGFLVSLIWNTLQLVMYVNEYLTFHEQFTLYLISFALTSMLMSVSFRFFMLRVSGKIEELNKRIDLERTRRLNAETPEVSSPAAEATRSSIIVRHEDYKEMSDSMESFKNTSMDNLSTLPNRDKIIEHIDDLIGNVISKSQASPESTDADTIPIIVTYLSIDGSEAFTHTTGHRTIDLFIQNMAHRIREAADSSDMVGRVAGTEFVVVTQRRMSEAELNKYVEHLCKSAIDSFAGDDTSIKVTASAGCSQYPRDSRFPGELVIMAESAMHEAFAQGGNRLMNYVSDEPLPENIFAGKTNTEISEIISAALNSNEFYMVYQPRFSRTGKLSGFEAFLRWDKADVSVLLAAAEKTGDIYKLGHFSLRQALTKLKEINVVNPNLIMNINFSSVQIRNGNFENDFMDIIHEVGCNVSNLVFDIPEESLLSGFSAIRELIEKLSDEGIRMALDNFGRGYSSLNNIPLLPVSAIKLDGNFTKTLNADKSRKTLTSSIISLLDEIDIPVCATGVESEEQYKILYDYNCKYFQGTFMCQPLASDKVVEYVRFRGIRE